jgi:hypothetical protein
MTKYVTGQYVELYPTIPSSRGGSVESGTRGIVREVEDYGDEALYRVAFLAGERVTGEEAWLNEQDLFPA